jgi:hypothetical protein
LCFDREELDRVLANGDHKRGRGRPRKGQFALLDNIILFDKV